MKVLYLVTAYPRDPGDVITPWLVELIRRLDRKGVDVEVLAPSYRGLGTQVVEGVTVHRFRYAPRPWETLTHDQTAPDRLRQRPLLAGLVPSYVAAGSLAARRLARTGRFQIVHDFWPLPHGVMGMAAKRAGRIPLVSTFFGVELSWMDAHVPFLAPVLRWIVRGSDAVTAISTYTAERVRQAVPGAAPVIIPFGPTVEPRPAAASHDGAGRVPGARWELLFVGRLVERKGVDVLLGALARLPGVTRPVLHVVGDGAQRGSLEARARELGILDGVTFHGFVAKDELEARIASCDALVLPAVVSGSGETEGLGVVLLEAMSWGKPVVASQVGGIVDIVRDGHNGVLVPPGDPISLADALLLLMNDPSGAVRMGRQGREDVGARFSWPVIVEQVLGVYDGVLARAPGPQR